MDNVQALENQILESMAGNLNGPYPINDFIEIDAETRSIVIPTTELIFGVKTDQDAERKYFRCPKIVGNNLDLSGLSLRVHFENANQEKDKYVIDDVVVDGDYITFSWLLSKKVLKYIGSVNFAICAVRTDYETGELKVAWNTTLGVGTVLMGLEVEDLTEDEEMESRDVLQQLLDMMDSEANENVQDVKTEGDTQIANVKSEGATQLASMKTEGASQVQTIETTGQNVLATIPEDYTAMSEQVGWNSRYLAPTVEQVAEGAVVSLNDSANMPLIGLNVYGKSEQSTTNGYQLIDASRIPTKNNGEVTVTNNGDGSFTISGSGTSTGEFNSNYKTSHEEAVKLLKAGTLYLSANSTSFPYISVMLRNSSSTYFELTNISSIQKNVEITQEMLDDEEAYLQVLIYGVAGREITPVTIKPMLYQDGDGTWEPYTGGKPAPNPDYPQDIVSVNNPTSYIYGKNLVDVPDFDSTNYSLSIIYGDVAALLPIGIPVIVDYEYIGNGTPSASTNYTVGIFYEGAEASIYVHKGEPFIFEKKIKRISIYGDTTGTATEGHFKNISIRMANTDSTFEAYKTKQTLQIPYELHAVPVTSGGNYTDSTGQQYICDEVDFERGVYVRRIGRYEVTGEENWYISNLQNYKDEGYYRYDVNTTTAEGALITDALCTHFPYNGANFKGAWVLDQEEYLSLRLIAPYSSVEALKTFFTEQYTSDNPVTYYYVLWNPIETPLNAEELEVFKALRTNYPNSTVINDSGAFQRVVYATDTKLYIDNKFAELAAKLT